MMPSKVEGPLPMPRRPCRMGEVVVEEREWELEVEIMGFCCLFEQAEVAPDPMLKVNGATGFTFLSSSSTYSSTSLIEI